MLFSMRKRLMGIDIQEDALRLVQLKSVKDGYCIERLILEKLPSGIFVQGRVHDWHEFKIILRDLVHKMSLQEIPAAMALSSHLVHTQCLQLPVGMNVNQIEDEIYAHIKRHAPGMQDELCVDFATLPSSELGYEDIFFSVTKQEYLNQYIVNIEQAGINIKIIDVDAHALVRSCTDRQKKHDDLAVLLINKNKALFVVQSSSNILFIRQWTFNNVNELCAGLKNALEFYLINNKNLLKYFILCGIEYYFEYIKNYLCSNKEQVFYYPDHMLNMLYSSAINDELLKSNIGLFSIAYGLAMREIPSW